MLMRSDLRGIPPPASSSDNLNGAVEMDAVLRASNIARLNIPQTLLARADEVMHCDVPASTPLIIAPQV